MVDYSQDIEQKQQPKVGSAAADATEEKGAEGSTFATPLASISEVYSFGEGKFWYVLVDFSVLQ